MPVSSAQGVAQSGKISCFGGPGDPSSGPTTSSGAPVSVPSISTYNQATKGGYWLVHMPNGKSAVLKQTDIGPAPWTGRNFDFTYTALPLLGYSQGNFPTDATITGTYLGKSVPSQYSHLVIGQGGSAQALPGGSASVPGANPGMSSTTTNVFDQAGFDAAQHKFVLGQYLRSSGSNPYDIGPKIKGQSSVGSSLLSLGILPTSAPNPQDYTTAQTTLQQLAGTGANVVAHPGATVPQGKGIGTVIAAANSIASHHYNYEWGGGHNPSFAPTTGSGHGSGPGTGYDCSGAISAILHTVGIVKTPMVAQDFMTFGQPGPGGPNDVTIYASSGHVFAKIGNKYFGTSGSNPGGGADWFSTADTSGFVVRHVTP